MKERIKSFEVYYLFYLKEHSNKTCRLLHIVGTTVVIALVITAIYHRNAELLILVPISGYGFAWIGHLFFKTNKPTTFKYTLWSLKSDFKMYFEILSGKVSLDSSKD